MEEGVSIDDQGDIDTEYTADSIISGRTKCRCDQIYSSNDSGEYDDEDRQLSFARRPHQDLLPPGAQTQFNRMPKYDLDSYIPKNPETELIGNRHVRQGKYKTTSDIADTATFAQARSNAGNGPKMGTSMYEMIFGGANSNAGVDMARYTTSKSQFGTQNPRMSAKSTLSMYQRGGFSSS